METMKNSWALLGSVFTNPASVSQTEVQFWQMHGRSFCRYYMYQPNSWFLVNFFVNSTTFSFSVPPHRFKGFSSEKAKQRWKYYTCVYIETCSSEDHWSKPPCSLCYQKKHSIKQLFQESRYYAFNLPLYWVWLK